MSHAHMHHGAERVLSASMPQASSDMNVTPLIDVLLVLLVIFIAALPLTQRGVDINLPLEVSPSKQQPDLQQIVVEYSAEKTVTVNKTPIEMEALADHLRGIFETRREKTLFIIGAPTARYGEIVRIIDAAQAAGVTKVGIVTEGMVREGQGLAEK